MTPTATERLAALILGQDLGTWVRARRAEGSSWRQVHRRLIEATHGQITVSYETLRRSYPDRADEPDEQDGDESHRVAGVRAS